MRRFIAFIVLALTVVLGIGFFTPQMMKSANLGYDFTSGREFVYSVEHINEENESEITEHEINTLANNISRRLDAADIEEYQISIEGNDQIRVRVSQEYNGKYEHIKQLVSVNSSFSLSTTDNYEEYFIGSDEFYTFFKEGEARVDFKSTVIPYFVIPLTNKTASNRLKEIQEHAQSLDTSSSDEETHVTSDAAKILLWSNWEEGDTWEKANSSDEGAQKVKDKIICAFDSNDFFFDTDQMEIGQAFTPTDGSNIHEYSLRTDDAQMLVNLFNAESLGDDLQLTYLFEEITEAPVEAIFTYGKPNMLSASRTIYALAVTIIVIGIFLIGFYRLHGLNAFVNTLVTLFATFAIFNVVGMTFNVGAIVGFVVVSVMSSVASIFYMEHLKNEVYRGRSLKKAHTEANKKSLSGVLDTHILTFVLGVIAYFLGTGVLNSLSIFLVIGSLVNIVIYFSFNRLQTWLLANDTFLQNKPNYFAIRRELIPDLTKEEKQQYYGPLAKVDFTKKTKRNGLVVTIVTAVFAIAMLGFGLFGNGMVNYAKGDNFTRAYYVIHEFSENDKRGIDVKYFEDNLGLDALKEAGIEASSVKLFETTDSALADEYIDYYVVEFNSVIDLEKELTIDGVNVNVEDYLNSLISDTTGEEIDQLYIREVRQSGANPTLRAHQPSLNNIILTVGIITLVGAVYLLVRYNIAKGLAHLLVSVISIILPLGFYALTRIEVTAVTFISLVAISVINTFLTIIVANKSKELENDRHNEELALEDSTKQALSISATPLLISSVLASYIALFFFGLGHPVYATTFATLLIGVLSSLAMELTLFVPIQLFLTKHVGNVDIKLPKRKHKKARKKVGNLKENKNRDDGPEESLYPGINDY